MAKKVHLTKCGLVRDKREYFSQLVSPSFRTRYGKFFCHLIIISIVALVLSLALYPRIFAVNDLKNYDMSKNIKLNAPVKKFLKEPNDNSKSVYDIAIGVRIIECTPDRKWYKVRISYNFIGYFEYEGWCKVE